MKLNRIVTCAVFILMAASFLLLEYGEGPVAAQVQGANTSLAEEDPFTFWVAPDDQWVQSSGPWTPGATISLVIEEVPWGGAVYTDSQTSDASGHFFFDLRDRFDLQRGHFVSVGDGSTSNSHTVTNLFVDGVDVDADTVFGRADAGTDVEVWLHDNGPIGLTVTADGSGDWTADFSGMSDITYLSDGSAQQGDHNATWVHWAGPQFWAAPDDEWVKSSSQWTPGATVFLTIADGGLVVYSDSQTIDAGGNFFFSFGDVFDLQRGHVVTVSDGTYAKTHTVANLFVDIVNVGTDTLSGRADAGADVEVWAEGSHQTVTADGSGNWTADFSGMIDITYLSRDDALQSDADGDATWVRWAGPTFQAAPEDDWVGSSSQWVPGATISLTIEDGGGVVYADSQTADGDGRFNFDLWDVFDLQRGHIVTVSDGTTTKMHTVVDLFVDGVDVTADTVFGRADPGADVDVWVHDDFGTNLTVTADGSGNWLADFSGMTDLTYASDGGSQQGDDDGDATGVWWAVPRFEAAPVDDWVQSSNSWTPGATISLTIEDGGGVVYADSQTADGGGNFNFGLWGVFDLQRGHVVTVSDGITSKTHTVVDLFVDGVDVDADTVFGRADPGADVDVWVHDDFGTNLTVTADGSGNWLADFSGMTDLTYASDGGSQQVDNDGDSTGVWWHSPRFEVAPVDDWVQSSNSWTPGATISLTIEDGGGVVYADSQTADAYGNFFFGLGLDLQRGHEVTVSDGTITKTHTVANLYVDIVDVAADIVIGRADAGADVEVWADDGNQIVTADGSGNWLADFSGMTDITYQSNGSSQQSDENGDASWMWWSGPTFQAAPEDDWVGSSGTWPAGATISLTIEDGGGVVYADSQTADGDGRFNFGLWGVFDLQRGHVVTVSDGITTKTHTVIDLFVDGVDVDADTVFGRAEAGADVDVWVHDDYNSNLTVTADGSGNWVADFSGMVDLTYASDGGSQQYDADGDATGVWWAGANVQEIYLNEGWNMISSYIEAGDPAVASILADIEDDFVLMKDGAGNVYWPDMGIYDIGSWDVLQGYQIYMDNAAVLRIYGAIVDAASTPIELPSGWSLIAYLRDDPMEIGPALGTISGALYLAKNGAGEVYWPVYGVDQIGDMQPGQGYQVYMDGPGTLTYP